MTYKLYANRPVEHHLLEIILWPNMDGTLRTITNTQDRLKKLGCYKEGIMTITMTNSEHTTLHNAYRDYSCARNPMYGKKLADITRMEKKFKQSQYWLQEPYVRKECMGNIMF